MLKDASHLPAQMITSALMILSGSFKLETRIELNENKSRYNPKTLQTSSAGRQRYISFKALYVLRRKLSNDKPIICHCSRLKPGHPQKSQLEKREFLHELGFLSYLKPLQMISVIMNDEVPLSLFKILVRGENDFHFLLRQHLLQLARI